MYRPDETLNEFPNFVRSPPLTLPPHLFSPPFLYLFLLLLLLPLFFLVLLILISLSSLPLHIENVWIRRRRISTLSYFFFSSSPLVLLFLIHIQFTSGSMGNVSLAKLYTEVDSGRV